jgi:hypothetical protein
MANSAGARPSDGSAERQGPMNLMRPAGVATVLALVAAVGIFASRPVQGDQRDTQIAIDDPSANITDTYFFPSPTNPNNVVVAMNVYPGIAQGKGKSTNFNSNLLYQMKFDSKITGSAVGSAPVENVVIQFLFTAPANGPVQDVYVYGPASPIRAGTNTALNSGAFAGAGPINRVFQANNGMTVFAGGRADPYFFNYNRFYSIFPNRNAGSTAASCLPSSCPQGFGTTGTNSQSGTNVLSIVVELPKKYLMPGSTGPKVAYWATTSSPNQP